MATEGMNEIFDRQVNAYLEEFENGRALTETNLAFQNKVFPAKLLPRKEGSWVSQFLSNHFPSAAYFERFCIERGKKL